MSNGEDFLDLLEDDGDGVNEMCLLLDKDSDKKNFKEPPQKTGCGVVLLMMGASVVSMGLILGKPLA